MVMSSLMTKPVVLATRWLIFLCIRPVKCHHHRVQPSFAEFYDNYCGQLQLETGRCHVLEKGIL